MVAPPLGRAGEGPRSARAHPLLTLAPNRLAPWLALQLLPHSHPEPPATMLLANVRIRVSDWLAPVEAKEGAAVGNVEPQWRTG